MTTLQPLDRHLARGQRRWAHMVLEWRENMGLTQQEFNTVQTALYGRIFCAGNRFGDFKVAALGGRPLNLGPANFIAICGVNRWFWEAQHGLVEPPAGFTAKRVNAMRPWLHNGYPIEPADMWGIYAGLEVMQVTDSMERIGIVLGDLIDQILVERGLSSRLDVWEFTRLMPNSRHQNAIAEATRSGTAISGAQVALMMPELLRALTQFTGETWTRERLMSQAVAPPTLLAVEQHPQETARSVDADDLETGRVLAAVNSL